jgi:hypothetical protein
MIYHTAFERAIADIWIEEIRAHRSQEELKRWAKDRADKIAMCEHVDELREAYRVRMEELKKGEIDA